MSKKLTNKPTSKKEVSGPSSNVTAKNPKGFKAPKSPKVYPKANRSGPAVRGKLDSSKTTAKHNKGTELHVSKPIARDNVAVEIPVDALISDGYKWRPKTTSSTEDKGKEKEDKTIIDKNPDEVVVSIEGSHTTTSGQHVRQEEDNNNKQNHSEARLPPPEVRPTQSSNEIAQSIRNTVNNKQWVIKDVPTSELKTCQRLANKIFHDTTTSRKPDDVVIKVRGTSDLIKITLSDLEKGVYDIEKSIVHARTRLLQPIAPQQQEDPEPTYELGINTTITEEQIAIANRTNLENNVNHRISSSNVQFKGSFLQDVERWNLPRISALISIIFLFSLYNIMILKDLVMTLNFLSHIDFVEPVLRNAVVGINELFPGLIEYSVIAHLLTVVGWLQKFNTITLFIEFVLLNYFSRWKKILKDIFFIGKARRYAKVKNMFLTEPVGSERTQDNFIRGRAINEPDLRTDNQRRSKMMHEPIYVECTYLVRTTLNDRMRYFYRRQFKKMDKYFGTEFEIEFFEEKTEWRLVHNGKYMSTTMIFDLELMTQICSAEVVLSDMPEQLAAERLAERGKTFNTINHDRYKIISELKARQIVNNTIKVSFVSYLEKRRLHEEALFPKPHL